MNRWVYERGKGRGREVFIGMGSEEMKGNEWGGNSSYLILSFGICCSSVIFLMKLWKTINTAIVNERMGILNLLNTSVSIGKTRKNLLVNVLL